MLLGRQCGLRRRAWTNHRAPGVSRLRVLTLAASAAHAPKVGDLVSGVVQWVQPFGAHIDLGGGFRGLLHRSQISQEFVESPEDVFSKGGRVKVLVVKEDRENGRYVLSTKQLEATPGDMLTDPDRVYDQAEAMAEQWRRSQPAGGRTLGAQTPKPEEQERDDIRVWQVVEGVVTSTTAAGAQIDVGGGWRAFMTVAGVSHGFVSDVGQVLKVGDKVKAIVSEIDAQQGSLQLSTKFLELSKGDMLRNPQLVYDNAEKAAERWLQRLHAKVGEVVPFRVLSVQQECVFVEMFDSIFGIVPKSNISKAEGVTPDNVFKRGDTGKALLTGISKERGRVTLSTRHLEVTPGDMLRDPQLVYDKAEEAAVNLRDRLQKMVGEVVPFRVLSVLREYVFVKVSGEVCGVLPISNISKAEGVTTDKVFKKDDTGKALLTGISKESNRVFLSTRHLEVTPGDMLRDPQLVYDKAEETAVNLRERLQKMVGQAVPFVVQFVSEGKVFVSIERDIDGVLPVEEISAGKVLTSSTARIRRGDRGMAVATGIDPHDGHRLLLSTKQLEAIPSDLLQDPRLVDDAAKGELLDSIQVHQVVEGVVRSVERYGAFVELHGTHLTGLIHVSQISRERVSSVEKVLKEGDRVKVLVLSKDLEKKRNTLSTKALEPKPGDMLRDKELVFQKAEEMAERFRERLAGVGTKQSKGG